MHQSTLRLRLMARTCYVSEMTETRRKLPAGRIFARCTRCARSKAVKQINRLCWQRKQETEGSKEPQRLPLTHYFRHHQNLEGILSWHETLTIKTRSVYIPYLITASILFF